MLKWLPILRGVPKFNHKNTPDDHKSTQHKEIMINLLIHMFKQICKQSYKSNLFSLVNATYL